MTDATAVIAATDMAGVGCTDDIARYRLPSTAVPLTMANWDELVTSPLSEGTKPGEIAEVIL